MLFFNKNLLIKQTIKTFFYFWWWNSNTVNCYSLFDFFDVDSETLARFSIRSSESKWIVLNSIRTCGHVEFGFWSDSQLEMSVRISSEASSIRWWVLLWRKEFLLIYLWLHCVGNTDFRSDDLRKTMGTSAGRIWTDSSNQTILFVTESIKGLSSLSCTATNFLGGHHIRPLKVDT